jgi:hypothetical protein
MLNNYDVYVAFNQCKKIYGVTEVHVQLIAKQLGVLAGDVIDVIDANSSLYATRMNSANSNYTSNVSGSEYAGMIVTGITAIPYLSTKSIIREADNGGTIVLTPSTSTFTNSTAAGNWTVDVGLTGLTLASVNNLTATKTLTFTGTAKPGTISIKCKADGIKSGVASDTLYFNVPEINFDYTTLSAIEARVTAAEADIDDLESLSAITIIDDNSASTAVVLDAVSQTVVVLDNNEKNIELPEATGSGIEIRIQNRNAADHDVVVSDSSGDVIDADGTITLAQYASCVLVDIANGVWSQF